MNIISRITPSLARLSRREEEAQVIESRFKRAELIQLRVTRALEAKKNNKKKKPPRAPLRKRFMSALFSPDIPLIFLCSFVLVNSSLWEHLACVFLRLCLYLLSEIALVPASRCPVNPISLFLERATVLTQRGALINLSAGMKKKLPLKNTVGPNLTLLQY